MLEPLNIDDIKVGTLILCFDKETSKLYSTRIVVNKKQEQFFYLKLEHDSNKLYTTHEHISSWKRRIASDYTSYMTLYYKFINKK